MSEVLKGHVVACLRVQMFLAIWTSEEELRKKTNRSLLYYSTVYVQIDGNILIVVVCPIPWSGNGASVEFLIKGCTLTIRHRNEQPDDVSY